MKADDKNKFLELMNGLSDIYTANLTKIGLQLRFDALKQYTIEQITKASNIIVRTRKFTNMPTPADFIEAIEGNPDEKAEIQKSLVMEAYNRYQPNQKFDDPITQTVIDKIGWRKIGQVNMKEVPFILNDFISMYKSYNKVSSGLVLNAPDEFKRLANDSVKEIK